MFVSAVSDRFKEALQVAGGIYCNVALIGKLGRIPTSYLRLSLYHALWIGY